MRRLAAVIVLTATACSDAGVTKFNTPPTAEISSHADGDTVREGFGETREASASALWSLSLNNALNKVPPRAPVGHA